MSLFRCVVIKLQLSDTVVFDYPQFPKCSNAVTIFGVCAIFRSAYLNIQNVLLQTILQRQLGMYPLIVLKDMQFSVLKSLIEFMYCGETSVTEDNLSALLQAAKFFQVNISCN